MRCPFPALLFLPDKKDEIDSVIIRLDHRGKSAVLEEDAFVSTHIGKGHVIVLADLRGMGETAENYGANDPKYYNTEYHNAILSLHTGQPLPGQRVKDIMSLLDFISSDDDLKDLPVKVIASGPAALPALFAAVLDQRIASLELSETIKSFAEITLRPMDRDWFSYVVPGIMNYFDLPDLVTLRPDLEVKYTGQNIDAMGNKIYNLALPLLILLYTSCNPVNRETTGTYSNPILHADYSDPDVIRVEDTFYMVASSFNCIPGLPVLKSKDLVSWQPTGYALDRLQPEEYFSKARHGGGAWAPCIRYHNNEFYIYYPDPDHGIFMVKAKDPSGPWSEPVAVRRGRGMIDPSPLWDDDGNAYMVYAFAGSRAGVKSVLMVSRMNDEGTSGV